jgi:predicted dehydrogenase
MTPRVALVGAGGHGRWHRRELARLHGTGLIRVVALCDVAPIEPTADGTPLFTDHRTMLSTVDTDIVVICTPPHTHLPIALDAVAAGCDLLLEKPPVLSRSEHDTLVAALHRSGRVAQVGFQALGSAALVELCDAVTAGHLGTVTAVSAAGAWQRDDAYWSRARWAGRRSLDGHPVLDGALVNPFAHALMQSLAVAGNGSAATIELERYRTRDLEVEDTASLRVTLDSGPFVVVAVTLCAEGFLPGEILVHGTAGRAVLEYPTDRLLLPGDAEPRVVPGRVSLLENLVAHRSDPAVPLVAPIDRTASFTALVEAISAAPPPSPVPPSYVDDRAGVRVITGIDSAVRQAADRPGLFSELPVAWALPPFHGKLNGGS